MTNELSVEDAIEALYTVRAYYASLTAGYPKGKDCKGIGDVMCSEIANSCLMAIKALEKDIAREPVQTHTRYGMGNEYHDFYCPSCDAFLTPEPKGLRWKQEGGWSRCSSCFQKIKWEEKQDG